MLGKKVKGRIIILASTLFLLGLVPTVVGHSIFNYSVRYIRPTVVACFPLGEPIIASIIALAHAYSKARDKQSFRNLKWGAIKGAATMGTFSLTLTFIGTPVFGFLVGLCAAIVVRKYIGYIKFLDYLKWMKKVRPAIKKVVTRREFLALNLFTFKRG